MRISCRTPIMSMRRIYATRAASCLARRRHRNSADVLLPRAGYVLPRAIPGTSSTLPAGRAAARPVLPLSRSGRWRAAAPATEPALKVVQQMGHAVERVKRDPAALLPGVAGIIITAGISSIPMGHAELMDPVVRVSWEQGKNVRAADYLNAVAQMHNISREIVQTLAPYDALITPTLTRPAVRLGTLPSKPREGLRELFQSLLFTFPFNAPGHPAFSIPNGFSQTGLPIGDQIVGPQNDKARILSLPAPVRRARPVRDEDP